MDDDERTDTQERDRVGQVAQHRFQQLKYALHQVVAHTARRLPGLALDHRGQQLRKEQQHQTDDHADHRQHLRHKRDSAHISGRQINAAQVGHHADKAVGREDELAPLAVAGVGVHIQYHGGQHQHNADVDSHHQDAGDGIHNGNRLGCHAKRMVERVKGLLVAKERTVDQAEDRARNAAGDHQMEQVIVLDLPHERAEQCQHDTLPDVAKHHAEQHGECDRYKAGDICLAVGGQTVHFDEKLKRAAPPGVLQLGGGRHLTGGFRFVHRDAQPMDAAGLARDLVHLRRRDPADAEEVLALDRGHAAQVVDRRVVAGCVVQQLDLVGVLLPQGGNAGVDVLNALVDNVEVLFKVLDDLGGRASRAGHMHRLKVEHREDAVGLQRVLPRGHVDAPVTGLRLVAGGEQDVRVVAVVVHQLVVALRRQEAEADLDVGAVENVVHVDLQAGKVAVLLDAVLAELLLVQQDLALGAEVVDLFQQVAQIAAALGIHRVAVLLPLVQLHIGLFGHRLDLVADRGVGVLLIQSAVSQRFRHISGCGLKVKASVHAARADKLVQLGHRALHPHQFHLFNQSVHTPCFSLPPSARQTPPTRGRWRLRQRGTVPRRGEGSEPCHHPKYFGLPRSSLPHRLRAEPPPRGGQGSLNPSHQTPPAAAGHPRAAACNARPQ